MTASSLPTPSPSRWAARYGPWAVVTGSSDGIGRALAVQLAEAGLNLVLVARRADVLMALAKDLQAAHGIECRVLALDLAQPDQVADLQAQTDDLAVGLLVAAAGFGTSGPFIAADLAAELAMLDVNCRAVLALSHHYGRRFAERGSGGLVLFSSLLAFQGVPRAANYAATKAYIQTFAEGLHQELAPLGVDVLVSAPGPVHSGFADRADMTMGFALTPPVVAKATLRALGRRTTVRPGWLSLVLEWALKPLPRWGRVRMLATIMGGMTRHQR
jgi:short-subunit dehydrogenase